VNNRKDQVNTKQQNNEEAVRCEDVSMLLLWMPNFTMDSTTVGKTAQLEDKFPAGSKPNGRDKKI
jgi:hypothetical protein